MHIPDGYLTAPVWASMDVVAAGAVAASAKVVQKRLGEQQVPALAVLAAFVFAAQMINFPLPGGTSGHLLGGLLVAILLGPWTAVLVLSVVIAAQCLIHQDGGLTALGANVLNMGVFGMLAGYGVYQVVGWAARKPGAKAAVFAGAWVSVMAAALATSLEIVVSGIAVARVALPAMLGVHAVVGVGEGLVTVAALSALASVRPDLLRMERI